jgi:hypothetical protein
MLRGVDVLANAVKVTPGPKGATSSSRSPMARVSKDGVTVVKEIELEDKFENTGAQMAREVASKQSSAAGGGTTTAPDDRAGDRQGRRDGGQPRAPVRWTPLSSLPHHRGDGRREEETPAPAMPRGGMDS